MLRMSIAMEKYIFFLENVRKWNNEGRDTAPLVEVIELLIPCILHLENRIGEKILTIILRKGLDAYQGSKDHFVQLVQDLIQTKILGSNESPSHWKLPYTKDDNNNYKLEAIQVKNAVCRRMIKEIDSLIEATVPEEAREIKANLIKALSYYQEAIELLKVHRELSDDEMEYFQDLVDDFFSMWVDIFGDEGITNYVHMLGSGHILYFMKKYGCLYLYFQQGWESLNNTVQTFIHQNSQRGGFGSGEGKGKSFIFLVVQMELRDLLWKTYEADNFFIELDNKGIAC
jgi:hypothetical protein